MELQESMLRCTLLLCICKIQQAEQSAQKCQRMEFFTVQVVQLMAATTISHIMPRPKRFAQLLEQFTNGVQAACSAAAMAALPAMRRWLLS